jgi:hypothetical protein
VAQRCGLGLQHRIGNLAGQALDQSHVAQISGLGLIQQAANSGRSIRIASACGRRANGKSSSG